MMISKGLLTLTYLSNENTAEVNQVNSKEHNLVFKKKTGQTCGCLENGVWVIGSMNNDILHNMRWTSKMAKFPGLVF